MAKDNSGGASGMLDGLKSKLGFGRKDEEFYDDDFGYDDYDDYSNDGYDDHGDNYGKPAQAGAYRPLGETGTSRSSRSRFGHGDSAADNLVSLDDVKEHTRSSEPFRSSYNSSYNASPEPAHSEGYDSLFESTETPVFTPYTPDGDYSVPSASSYASARPLTVIKPVVYGDVERVAPALRSGDVVVLVMRDTPEDVLMRILDFSFGVAYALDARAEWVGDKVFALSRDGELTEVEKERLRNQGALR